MLSSVHLTLPCVPPFRLISLQATCQSSVFTAPFHNCCVLVFYVLSHVYLLRCYASTYTRIRLFTACFFAPWSYGFTVVSFFISPTVSSSVLPVTSWSTLVSSCPPLVDAGLYRRPYSGFVSSFIVRVFML